MFRKKKKQVRKCPIITDQFVFFPSHCRGCSLYKRSEESADDGRGPVADVVKNKVQIELSCSHTFANSTCPRVENNLSRLILLNCFKLLNCSNPRTIRRHLWLQKWKRTGQNDHTEEDQSARVTRLQSLRGEV